MNIRMPWQDRRQLRADALAAMAFRAIEHFLDRSPEATEANVQRQAHTALFELFYQTGAEVITDLDRANAGLPARGKEGYTDQELHALEAATLDAMMRPIIGTAPLHGVNPVA